MSLETQIAGAVIEARKVFDLVTGQFSKWDEQVKAQMKNLEDWKKGVIDTVAKGHRQVITVGGDKDIYYPVFWTMSSSNEAFQLVSITRGYSATGPAEHGSHKMYLNIEFKTHNGDWGGSGGDNLILLHHRNNYRKGCAGISTTAHGMKNIVWLRGGGYQYIITTSGSSKPSIEVGYEESNITYNYSDSKQITKAGLVLEADNNYATFNYPKGA